MAPRPAELGDFTATWRLVPMSLGAVAIGVLSALVARALLALIGLFTNLAFFQRWDVALVSPVGHHLGVLVVVVPAIGALLIGLLVYYGSERIRGHGIPEAIESILIGGSRIEPRVAVLKPLSTAISIGTGGPFGADVERHPVVAHPDEPLRAVVYRMAETGLTRFPVVEPTGPPTLVGMVGLRDLLAARVRNLEAERRRERPLPLRLRPPWKRQRGRMNTRRTPASKSQ
jgi:CBS domain-containing protein